LTKSKMMMSLLKSGGHSEKFMGGSGEIGVKISNKYQMKLGMVFTILQQQV